jgi:lipoprotein-anchoring transpeptidase ErfK/SrfK
MNHPRLHRQGIADMTDLTPRGTSRRQFNRSLLAAGIGASLLGQGAAALAQDTGLVSDVALDRNGYPINPDPVKSKISSFTTRNWQGFFSNLSNGAILVDTKQRALHFWPEGGAYYKIYPVSVPLTPELTRLGRTAVVRKVVGPEWRPTARMLQRNPELPTYVGPGPDNPLGTHAMYLTWEYYRIHGTNDTRKIGRLSSNGCIGLYNEQIEELFNACVVGTQVLLI